MTLPLMPKATAVWLIDKTALTFTQIAEFCGMHPLEVQAIADGEVAAGINGYDPVKNNQLTQEQITRCEGNADLRLKISAKANPVARRAKAPATRQLPAVTTDRTQSRSSCASFPSSPSCRSSSCSARPRTPLPRCATASIGTAPTSNHAIR